MSEPDLDRRRRLWSPQLGLGLVVITAGAWVTGLPYLLVRLGWPFPVPLLRFDGPHVYLGLVLALLLAAKTAHFGLQRHLPGLAHVLLWHRWLSYALLVLYLAVFASGLALLLPASPSVKANLVDLHLMAAIWAGVATVVHLRVHARWLPLPSLAGPKIVAAVVILLLPVGVFALEPASLAPLTRLGAGSAWRQVGPAHIPFLHLLRVGKDRLLAVGDGLWVSGDQGATWRSIDGLSDHYLLSVAADPRGGRTYLVGGVGLYTASDPAGPYSRLEPPSASIDVAFVDPADPAQVWLGGHGLWESTDAGASWSPAERGIVRQGSIWTFARYQGALYTGGSTGVYRWVAGSWTGALQLPEVISLDAEPNGLWAASMGGGLAVLRDGRWRPADDGLASHHGGGIHVASFVETGDGRAFAGTMHDGVGASLDGGASWSELSPGFQPGTVWQLVWTRRGLLAATDTGLYSYQSPTAPPPAPAWWLALLAAAMGLTTVGVAIGLSSNRQVQLPAPSQASFRWLRMARGGMLNPERFTLKRGARR